MRFTQPPYPTVFFSEKIIVKCNECSGVGVVSTKLGTYTIPFPHDHKSTFTCTSCGTIKKHSKDWHGYYQGFLTIPCGSCGSKIVYTTKPEKKITETTKIKFHACKKTTINQLKQ